MGVSERVKIFSEICTVSGTARVTEEINRWLSEERVQVMRVFQSSSRSKLTVTILYSPSKELTGEKVKIFQSSITRNIQSMEDEINSWLEENNVQISKIIQSSSGGEVVLTIIFFPRR